MVACGAPLSRFVLRDPRRSGLDKQARADEHVARADAGGGTRRQPNPTKAKTPASGARVFFCFVSVCRGGQIRTADLSDPNRTRYQAALRPGRRRRTMVCEVRSVKDETTALGDFYSALGARWEGL